MSSISDYEDPDSMSCVEYLPIECESSTEFERISMDGVKEWIPASTEVIKPYIGTVFDTLQDGILHYQQYAQACGFSTRLLANTKWNRDKSIVWHQTIVCNRQGIKSKKEASTSKSKKEASTSNDKKEASTSKNVKMVTRFKCNAKIVLKLCVHAGAGYIVHDFHEGHTHTMSKDKYFEKSCRNLSLVHKMSIVNNGRNNVGPTTTFRLCAEQAGGFHLVGAEVKDFKNYQGYIKVLISEPDPQMLIDNFQRKQEMWDKFYYAYEVDDDNSLSRVFWCDPISIKNYAIFGDVVSFDTTFKSNKYNMVFGIFTGLDNHNSCSTFGSCLIANEDYESFVWVFNNFIKAMGGREPTFLFTDQDPAMDKAFPLVFRKTQHRFCVWHIMKKIPDKIGRVQAKDFMYKLSTFVWNEEIEPDDFESKWDSLLTEYELHENGWLSRMYEMRGSWIPSYFRDAPLGCLLTTTSISESQNRAFTSFTTPQLTLVEFYARFENALEYQRYKQSKKDYDDDQKRPEMKSKVKLEQHAAEVYTESIFRKVQDEILVSEGCGMSAPPVMDGAVCTFGIHEGKSEKRFTVSIDVASKQTDCSCKLISRRGYPCSHMIWVWNAYMIYTIPKQYIIKRWCKDITRLAHIDYELDEQCSSINGKKSLLQTMWSEVLKCTSAAQFDEAHIKMVIHAMRSVTIEIQSTCKSESASHPLTKKQEVEMLIGQPIPTDPTIKPPKISKNKGTGVHVKGIRKDKRLLSDKEKAIARHDNKRQCKTCKKYANHDSRNCPSKKGKQVAEDLEEMDDNDTSDCSD